MNAPAALRRRFWLETIFAALALCLGILTVAYPDWIEIVFHIDPDAGNGAAEWAVTGTFAIVAVVLGLLARNDRRRLLATATS